MPNQNTLGVVSTEVVADLSKLDSSLRAALSSANTAGQQIGSKISDGIKSGLGSSEPVLGYFDNIRAHADVFKAAMENVATSLEKFRAPLNQLGGDLQSFGGKLSLGITAPLVALGAASIKSSADMDSLFRGLTAVAGSADGARRQFAELVEVAKLPGLGLEEAVQGSIRLQAFGFSSKEAKDALLAFGNAIATVGGGRAELDRVIVQLGQMAGAGKVLTQDLRPIIQTVPQVAEILKKSFGADVLSDPAAKFEKLGLSAKDVVKVLVTELGKLPKVTGGLKNDLENFSDSMKQSLAKLGDSIGTIAGPVLGVLAKSVTTAVDLFVALPGPVQTAAIAIAGVAAAAGPTIFALGSMARATSDLIGLAGKWAEWSRNAAMAAEATREIATAGTAAQTAITTAGAAAQASTGAFGAMATAIGLAGTAFTLLAAGFAAFTLGQWLEENVPAIHELSIRLADLMHGNHDLVESEAQLKEANDGLKDSTDRLASKLREFGVDVTRLSNETLMEYAARLRELANEQKTFTTIFSATSGSLNTWSKAAQEVITKQTELTAKYKEAQAVLAELHDRQKFTEVSAGTLAAAQKNLKDAYEALNPKIKAVVGSTADLIQKQDELYAARNRALKAIDDLNKLQAQGKDVTVALRMANEELNKALDDLAKKGAFIPPVFDAIAGHATDATRAMTNMFDAIAGGLPKAVALTGDMTAEMVKAGDGFVRVIRGNTTAVEENGKTVIKVKAAHDDLASSITKVGTNAVAANAGLVQIGSTVQQAGESTGKLYTWTSKASDSIAVMTEEVSKASVQLANGSSVAGATAREVLAVAGSYDAAADAAGKSSNGTDGVTDAVRVLTEVIGAVDWTSPFAAMSAAAKAAAGEIAMAATQMKNMADMASGFKASSGFSPSTGFAPGDPKYGTSASWQGSGGSALFSTSDQNGLPLTPGIGYISGVGGGVAPMTTGGAFNSLQFNMVTEEDVAAADKLREALAKLAEAGLKSTLTEVFKLQKQMMNTGQTMEEVVAQWVALGEAQTAAKAAAEGLRKATDLGGESAQDLQDQLWRLIDAGQGNTMAAWDLRTRIEALTGSYNTQANAAAAAGTSMKQASAAIFDASGVITTAVKNVATSTTQARAAILEQLTPKPTTTSVPYNGGQPARASINGPNPYQYYGPTNTAPYTFIPTPTTPSMDNSPYMPGLGAQPLTIQINGGGSAALVGQQVTQVLRTQAGYQ